MANTEQDLRREIGDERKELADAVVTLRSAVRSKIPLVAAGVAGVGFVASGGLRATARALLRRRKQQ
jgi:hypothetical protein